MTDTATITRPFQLGDRVTYTYGGRNYAGTVRGLFHTDGVGTDGATNGHAPESVFVTNANADNRPSVAYRPNVSDQTGEQYRWADGGIPEGEQGIWASLRYDGVALDPTAETTSVPTVDPNAHQEALDTITRLRAELSEQQSLVSTAHDVVRTIGAQLAETADDHNWCGDYDSKVSDLYGVLPGRGGFDVTFRDAAIRNREYVVSFTGTHTVTARNADEASEVFGSTYVGDLDRYALDVSDVEPSDD